MNDYSKILCESFLYLVRKYICIISLVLFYLTRFRFVSFRKIV